MQQGIKNIVLRSLSFYRKDAFYQFIIIAVLSSVITGSLLTGYSVRNSLKSSAIGRLGNTGMMITSGLRNFSRDLSERLQAESGIRCTAVLETDGFSRGFDAEAKTATSRIYGIEPDFFSFLGYRQLSLNPGEAAINRNLASRLNVSEGQDLIININPPADIPANSPFAPSSDPSSQRVFRIAHILESTDGGDFSPAINQMTPDNVFINTSDLFTAGGGEIKANRIYFDYRDEPDGKRILGSMKKVMRPEDLGLKIRNSSKTGEAELVSSRIFIDSEIISGILSVIPQGHPVITYLVNDIAFRNRSTPYSFVAAIDPAEGSELNKSNGVVISRWLAEDLGCGSGDTISLKWYAPGKLAELEEVSRKFLVSGISPDSGIWADSLLMPEFPGIAGSESCTDWDAGVKIKMDKIRSKDEDYWNNYRGRPKAYISYTLGREIWGNNFGPATAIRFPSVFLAGDISGKLTGALDPGKCGFAVRNLREDMIKAADQSVDFSTLFLSLGFFIVISCIFLLLLAVTSYFDSRKEQVFAFFALGFTDRWISRLLFYETAVIAVSGSIAGVIAGLAINAAIIAALNSVWIGAVQSGTLSTVTGISPLILGFAITIIMAFTFLYLRIKRFLSKLREVEKGDYKPASSRVNLILLLISAAAAIVTAMLAFTSSALSTSGSFIAGALLFLSLILLWRQIIIVRFSLSAGSSKEYQMVSGSYYSSHPSRAVMPVLLIAAGLFAVIITGINRLQISESSISTSGGTGGYKLWMQTVTPVKEDINSISGRKFHGLDEVELPGLSFVQGRVAAGDDASCLNLNYVASPPLLGIDPSDFIREKSFSFKSLIKAADRDNPWEILARSDTSSLIYGFADQTVLEWGLKRKVGDTLMFRSESGERFNVVIAGGMKSSVFQGFLIIGENNFIRYYPSVAGHSLFLAACEGAYTDQTANLLRNRFESYGVKVERAEERLSSFFMVTNTYLSVFTTLGAFGLILGVVGLGFVLRQNYNSRKREFAFMMAAGFTEKRIKGYVFREQLSILIAGVIIGIVSALVSTLPSISGGSELPWVSLILITAAIIATGIISLLTSLKSVRFNRLISGLRRE